MDVIIQAGRDQVIGRRDGMHIAGKVQVDVFHRHYLRITAAGSAALQPEYRSEAWLTQRHHRLLADAVQRVSQADRRRRLSFSGLGRVDRRDQDQLAVFLVFVAVEHIQAQLGFVLSIIFQIVFVQSDLFSYAEDRIHHTFLCDLQISFTHRASSSLIIRV